MHRNLLRTVVLFYLHLAASSIFAQMSDVVALQIDGSEPIKLQRLDHNATDMQIDGRLDELVWQRLKPMGTFRVTKPDTMKNTPYATHFRALYTDEGLYLSLDMEQPAETIIQRSAPRDANELARDAVTIVVDTSGTGRYGYWIGLSLGDGEMDGTILPERKFDGDWDGAWYGATQRTEIGWVAEFYIPWSQMAMPKADGVRRIGIYASRKVAHLDERWGWPALTETQPRFMSAMQPLELVDVDPRQQWSVFPYVSATIDRVDDNSGEWKTGADLFWRPSSNFQLTGTLNPDFGSVESDNVVVNLTADETFFPEKRLFFQEGQEIFNVAGSEGEGWRPSISVVNTRRIGGRPRDLDLPDDVSLSRRDQLKVADIMAAAKATGQIGSLRYGLLAASEEDTRYTGSDNLAYSMSGRDFGVLRVLYEDAKGAAYRGLGWLSTVVAHPDSDAIVHGADFHWLTTSGKWNFNGQIIHSDKGDDEQGTGILADATYTPRQGLSHEFTTILLDDTIDVNDLGYQRRNDVNEFVYRLRWNKSGLERVRNFSLSPFFRYEVNGDGFRTFHGYGLSGNLVLNSLHSISGFIGYFPPQYDDRSSFGNGTFAVRGRSYSDLWFRTNRSKALSTFLRLSVQPQDVYGTTIESQLGLTWRPWDNLAMELEVTHKDNNGWLLHQDDQDFTTFNGKQWQPKFSLDYYPTSKQQLSLAMQWVGIQSMEDRFFMLPGGTTELVEVEKPNDETDDFSISQLNFQLRYRWQIAPLSDLFVVYTKGDSRRINLTSFSDMFNDNWDNPLGDYLVIKLRYRLGS